MKYRPGDVLLVRATVVEASQKIAGTSDLLLNFSEQLVERLDFFDVESVELARIEVGDTVRRPTPAGHSYGKVLAINEDALWVQLSKDSALQTWRTSECERVD